MIEKRYCYILEKYPFYEGSKILMISASCIWFDCYKI